MIFETEILDLFIEGFRQGLCTVSKHAAVMKTASLYASRTTIHAAAPIIDVQMHIDAILSYLAEKRAIPMNMHALTITLRFKSLVKTMFSEITK